jgi:hypothetical protein
MKRGNNEKVNLASRRRRFNAVSAWLEWLAKYFVASRIFISVECKCMLQIDRVLKVAVHRHFPPLRVAEQASGSHFMYKTHCNKANRRLRRYDNIDEFMWKVWRMSRLDSSQSLYISKSESCP